MVPALESAPKAAWQALESPVWSMQGDGIVRRCFERHAANASPSRPRTAPDPRRPAAASPATSPRVLRPSTSAPSRADVLGVRPGTADAARAAVEASLAAAEAARLLAGTSSRPGTAGSRPGRVGSRPAEIWTAPSVVSLGGRATSPLCVDVAGVNSETDWANATETAHRGAGLSIAADDFLKSLHQSTDFDDLIRAHRSAITPRGPAATSCDDARKRSGGVACDAVWTPRIPVVASAGRSKPSVGKFSLGDGCSASVDLTWTPRIPVVAPLDGEALLGHDLLADAASSSRAPPLRRACLRRVNVASPRPRSAQASVTSTAPPASPHLPGSLASTMSTIAATDKSWPQARRGESDDAFLEIDSDGGSERGRRSVDGDALGAPSAPVASRLRRPADEGLCLAGSESERSSEASQRGDACSECDTNGGASLDAAAQHDRSEVGRHAPRGVKLPRVVRKEESVLPAVMGNDLARLRCLYGAAKAFAPPQRPKERSGVSGRERVRRVERWAEPRPPGDQQEPLLPPLSAEARARSLSAAGAGARSRSVSNSSLPRGRGEDLGSARSLAVGAAAAAARERGRRAVDRGLPPGGDLTPSGGHSRSHSTGALA